MARSRISPDYLKRCFPVKRCFSIVVLLAFIGCEGERPSQPKSAPVPSTSIAQNNDMPPKLTASAVTKETFYVGVEWVVQSGSSIGRYQAVFEDDGDTGYFYALDTEKADNPIVDALHIYSVDAVTDKDKPSGLHIIWSSDGMKVALFISSYPHAVYNFTDVVSCCRSGFPPPADASASHEWDESQIGHLYANDGK